MLEGKIVIGNEIGCGIVPVDGFERQWRNTSAGVRAVCTGYGRA